MKVTRDIMGMPISVEVLDGDAEASIEDVFDYFNYVDKTFSTYKTSSEISKINRGELEWPEFSDDMKEVMQLSEKTRFETDGYFDIRTPAGTLDPSGLVKGWAIQKAVELLKKKDHKNFSIDAGGDIQTSGVNKNGKTWSVGVRNPFKKTEIVKVIYPHNKGVATSGIYERGAHIYNPKIGEQASDDVASLTVIGPNIYEADRFATAAFAMGKHGIEFIGRLKGFDGYQIDKHGTAVFTDNFEKYLHA